MHLRLIEIFIPPKDEYRVHQALKDREVMGIWQERFSKELSHIKILLTADETEVVLDLLEKHISRVEGFRIILIPVDASIPRLEPLKEKVPVDKNILPEKNSKKVERISRAELYADIEDTIVFSWVFVLMALLSSVVAAIGIMQDNVAVIIGAMVIAPLLGPNLALSLATTLGDTDLARRALKANFIGIFSALSFAALVGYMLKVDPMIPGIASRTKVSIGDIVLALAAGSAAALSLTTGISSALIGVMVAVALLPPLVVFGMLIGSGHFGLASGALMLVLVNLICINLAGVTTFLGRGIHPRKYWEADRAKKATKIAIVLWTLLLLVLLAVILMSR